MTTSVPWADQDISRESRETARQAAARAGLSTRDWLDALIASTADGGRRGSAVSRGAAATADTARLEAARDRPASDEILAATGTDGVAFPRTYATGAQGLRTSTALQTIAEQIARFERPHPEAMAQGSDVPPTGAPSVGGAAGAAATGSRVISVRDAVAEIARRQAMLDADGRDEPTAPASVEAAARPMMSARHDPAAASSSLSIGALGDAVSALEARLGSRGRGATRRPDIGRDGRPADTTPSLSEPTTNDTDAAFAALSRDLRRAIGNLDARPASTFPAAAPTAENQDLLGDIRSLLDRFRPGSALDSIDKRVQTLSDRLERHLDAPSSSDLLEGLSRRIEEMHASLRATAPASDLRNVEALMRGVASRIDDTRDASANILALEEMVRRLSEKVEASAVPFDAHAMSAIEAQIERLAERLERSEANLSSLDAVERSLGELFSQIEQTRHATIDAAETAARTAARDTLRAAMQSTAVGRQPDTASDAVERVGQTVAELRLQHEAAERRTQHTLSGLQQAMERLVGHLETVGVAGRRPFERASSAPVPPPTVQPAAEIVPPVTRSEPVVAPLPKENRSRRREEAERRPVDMAADPLDSLIEPRAGRGRATEPEPDVRAPRSPSASVAAEPEGAAGFIAAARRAAQAAQASAAEERGGRRGRNRPAKPATARGSALRTLAHAKAYLAARRRPILLSLAGLVLLMGGLEIVRVGMQPAAPGEAPIAAATAPDATPAKDIAAVDAGAARQDDLSPLGDTKAPPASSSTKPPEVVAGPGKAPGVPMIVAPSLDAASPSEKPVARSTNPFLAGLTTGLAGLPDTLKALANAGDAAAEYEVGLRFAEGRSVPRDPKAAVDWLMKAAAQGLAPAQYRLGSAYEKGIGVKADPGMAMTLYERAAEAGNVRAMHNLAVMSAEGAAGKPDYAKAASWFAKASDFGVRDSQFNLAILYARGLGIEQNLGKSYLWFALAASQGDEDAAKKRDEVAARLDAKALEAAKAAVAAFHPATPAAATNEVAPPPGGWDAAAPATRTIPMGQKGTAPKAVMM